MRPVAVDYDRLADRFDERYKHQTYPGIQRELRRLIVRPGIDVLEVGCGTGHWLAALSDLCVRLHGVDPSPAMLEKARFQPVEAKLACASAENLPFSSNSVDVIFCVNAFHHFLDPNKFLRDSGSLLRNTGRLAIFGLDPHSPDVKWYLYEHFPGLQEKDLERYIPHKEIGRLMAEAGFQNVVTTQVDRIQKAYLGEEVLSDPFLDRTSTSQLQLISEEAYTQGRQNIASLIERAKDDRDPIRFIIDLPFQGTVGAVS
jgi:SAM-dependent methyltransferase